MQDVMCIWLYISVCVCVRMCISEAKSPYIYLCTCVRICVCEYVTYVMAFKWQFKMSLWYNRDAKNVFIFVHGQKICDIEYSTLCCNGIKSTWESFLVLKHTRILCYWLSFRSPSKIWFLHCVFRISLFFFSEKTFHQLNWNGTEKQKE